MEMDLRLEAAAASEFRENLEDDPDFRAPAVDWDRTTREVMTMEWIDARRWRSRSARRARPRPQAPSAIVDPGLSTPCAGHRLFSRRHAPGQCDGGCGRTHCAGRLRHHGPARPRRAQVSRRSALRLHQARLSSRRRVPHIEIGYVSSRFRVEDFAQAIRAIGEPIHARPANQISMARLLTLLFEVTALFDMTTRVELVMLQKTMVVVEGVARRARSRAQHLVHGRAGRRAWIARNLGPLGRLEDASRGLSSSPSSSPMLRGIWRKSRLGSKRTQLPPSPTRNIVCPDPLCTLWLSQSSHRFWRSYGTIGDRRPDLPVALAACRFPSRHPSPQGVTGRLDAGGAERLHSWDVQSRIANTTIMVIAILLSDVAILCYRWWH